jgi:NAD(P)-dependent dehydrogenase (short-subunit alcohol dehydrogenase family)
VATPFARSPALQNVGEIVMLGRVPSGLENEIALITGAGRGIGREIALAFAREGAHLVLVSRTESELADAAAACSAVGVKARALVADVATYADLEHAVAAALAEHGRVDIAVGAAGALGPIGPLWTADPSVWERTIRVNLLGAFHLCRAVLPHMLRQRRGKILLLAGGGGGTPLPRFSAYASSKAAIVRLTETLADEVRDAGVHVNALAPGFVDTRLLREIVAAGSRGGRQAEGARAALEGDGLTPPGEVAALACFLVSSASGGLTGKLVSAPHDRWREWGGQAEELNSSPLYTLRRLDPFTLDSLSGASPEATPPAHV